ncbi:Ribonuclease H domain-containing protein [Hirschfeldia incana]|nr:Ribonuclease H domain-containing protein [Hirschfeldia incana]
MARREDRSVPKPNPGDTCTIQFDGASRGNPGRAGAGAVLRGPDNTVISSSREGLGFATNNVAEYRALNLGLESALNQGFRNVRVQGDSQLVCKQVRGEWATRHPNMTQLCGQAQELMSQFDSCDVQHVPRDFNSEADAQANRATNLAEGECQEDFSGRGYGRRGY